jgi:hypothetical protein
MAGRIVLQHKCVRPDFDDGAPLQCSCGRRIRRSQARALVRAGHAHWKKVMGADGSLTESTREIIINAAPKFPLAHTIGQHEIIAFAVKQTRWAKEFVNLYGGVR